MFLAGAQLARGYLSRPGPTSEWFVPCPFGPPGRRIYRTGDLARWRQDGDLDAEVRSPTLRAGMAAMLPAHMLPAATAKLDALPMAAHGKPDRRAVPAPQADSPSRRAPPSSRELSSAICSPRSSVLRRCPSMTGSSVWVGTRCWRPVGSSSWGCCGP